jgi:hypothetical protein
MRAIWFIALGMGCASTLKSTEISRANVGTKYARQTGYFASCGSTCFEEETRGGIRHDALLDEVMLARVDPTETCFDVVLRTEESKDEPFSELTASCGIDGGDQRAVFVDEQVSVYDHAYVGMSETAVVEGVTATDYLGLSLSQPTDKVFRVIERRGTMCCARATGSSARVELRNRQFDFGMSKGKLEMVWKLSG